MGCQPSGSSGSKGYGSEWTPSWRAGLPARSGRLSRGEREVFNRVYLKAMVGKENKAISCLFLMDFSLSSKPISHLNNRF